MICNGQVTLNKLYLRQAGLLILYEITLDPTTFKLLFCALVRPHLDYAVGVWNPYFQRDIDFIESVPRRATKIVDQSILDRLKPNRKNPKY